MCVSNYNRLARQLSFLIATVALAGCMGDAPSHLSLINRTDVAMRVASVQVNGKHVSSMSITVPPSPIGKPRISTGVFEVLLPEHAKVVAMIEQNGSTVAASCALPRRPDGVCIALVSFSGSESLRCGFDCYDSSASK
jgi:hypothetical protein